MPRVPDWLLRSVVYLYPSERDAREDTRFGATGFLFSMTGVDEGDWHRYSRLVSVYAVTAAHVVVEKAARVLRFNTSDGFDTMTVDEPDWYWRPDEHGNPVDDLAVCPVDDLPLEYKTLWPVSHKLMFSDPRDLGYVGAGDDVVMVGRFVDRGGKTRNLPALRFGNVSMLPTEPMITERDVELWPFLAEMRSRGGYSGSPVFTYKTDFDTPPLRSPEDLKRLERFGKPFPYLRLLGVDHGQYPTLLELVDDKGDTIPGRRVRERSAMSVVVPSWRLKDLLMDERLVEMRRRREEERRRAEQAEPARPMEETAEEKRPFSRSDFDDALRKATRRVEPSKHERE